MHHGIICFAHIINMECERDRQLGAEQCVDNSHNDNNVNGVVTGSNHVVK